MIKTPPFDINGPWRAKVLQCAPVLVTRRISEFSWNIYRITCQIVCKIRQILYWIACNCEKYKYTKVYRMHIMYKKNIHILIEMKSKICFFSLWWRYVKYYSSKRVTIINHNIYRECFAMGDCIAAAMKGLKQSPNTCHFVYESLSAPFPLCLFLRKTSVLWFTDSVSTFRICYRNTIRCC